MSLSRRALLVAVPLLWIAALGSAAGAIYSKHRARELFRRSRALGSSALFRDRRA